MLQDGSGYEAEMSISAKHMKHMNLIFMSSSCLWVNMLHFTWLTYVKRKRCVYTWVKSMESAPMKLMGSQSIARNTYLRRDEVHSCILSLLTDMCDASKIMKSAKDFSRNIYPRTWLVNKLPSIKFQDTETNDINAAFGIIRLKSISRWCQCIRWLFWWVLMRSCVWMCGKLLQRFNSNLTCSTLFITLINFTRTSYFAAMFVAENVWMAMQTNWISVECERRTCLCITCFVVLYRLRVLCVAQCARLKLNLI